MSLPARHSASVPIPTTEPAVLYTGDTWAWTRTLADYPASTHTLKYTLINTGGRINITATADGDVHEVSVAAATTAAYTAGTYTWQAYVEAGSERFTVDRGEVIVRSGYSSGSGGADARTPAQVALDAAMTAFATYTASRGMINEYAIGGRTMRFRSIEEITRQVNFWRNEVNKEQGTGTSTAPGKILTRFGS
jgi:membrane-bound inhibitor of C-type lysozyme